MATFVMAFGIATSIIAMQTGFRQIDLARTSSIAEQIIQNEMERLRMMSWTGITTPTTSGGPFGSASINLTSYFTNNATISQIFSGTTTVAYDSSSAANDIVDITVTVTWKTFDGRSHTRSYTSIYCKNGLYDYYYTVAHS